MVLVLPLFCAKLQVFFACDFARPFRVVSNGGKDFVWGVSGQICLPCTILTKWQSGVYGWGTTHQKTYWTNKC